METMETHFIEGPRGQTWAGVGKFCSKICLNSSLNDVEEGVEEKSCQSQVKSEMIGGNLLAVIILCPLKAK